MHYSNVNYQVGINITVGTDKPLAHLIVVSRLSVDKGQVLWSVILDTPFFTSCTTFKGWSDTRVKLHSLREGR